MDLDNPTIYGLETQVDIIIEIFVKSNKKSEIICVLFTSSNCNLIILKQFRLSYRLTTNTK